MHAFALRHWWEPVAPREGDLQAFRWASPVVPVNEYEYRSRDNRTWVAFHEIPTRLFPAGASYYESETGTTFFDGHIWPLEAAGNPLPNMAEILREKLTGGTADSFRAAVNGEYAFVQVDETENSITAFCDPAGLTPLYFMECSDGFIVSNRIFAIHALEKADSTEIDLDTISYFATWGLVPPHRTIYRRIKEIGAGSVLKAGNKEVRLHRNPRPYHDLPGCQGDEVTPEVWDRALLEMTTNLRFLHHCPEIYPQLGLSGGKDSRLILALALHEGVANKVLYMTQGLDSHPDVIVAKEITEHFSLPHRIQSPTHAGPVNTMRIFDEAMPAHMFLSEGMLNVFDPHGAKRCGADPMLTGLNGGNFRSNYDLHGHKTHSVKDAKTAKAFFDRSANLNIAGIARMEVVENHRAARYQWIDEQIELGIPAGDIPTLQYNSFQSLRRNCNAKKINGFWQHTINVLNGNTLYWLAHHIGAEARRRELVHFELMRRTAPWLVEHRFANQTWHKALFPHYPPPKPAVATKTEQTAFKRVDWRTHIDSDPEFRQHVMDFVMNVPASSHFWSIVDRGQLEKFFKQKEHSHMSRFHFFGALTIAMVMEKRRSDVRMEAVKGYSPVFVKEQDTEEVFVACQGKLRFPEGVEKEQADRNPAAVFSIAPEVMPRFRRMIEGKPIELSWAFEAIIAPNTGFHRVEKAHVWLEKQAAFHIDADLSDFSFLLAPPSKAFDLVDVVETEIRNTSTGAHFVHQFIDTTPQRFDFHDTSAGDEFTISTSFDFTPAEHGEADTRKLALKFFEVKLELLNT